MKARYSIRFTYTGPAPSRSRIRDTVRDYNKMVAPKCGPARLLVLHPAVAETGMSVPDDLGIREVRFDPALPRGWLSVGRWVNDKPACEASGRVP